jgi:hypothetical protein
VVGAFDKIHPFNGRLLRQRAARNDNLPADRLIEWKKLFWTSIIAESVAYSPFDQNTSLRVGTSGTAIVIGVVISNRIFVEIV